MQHYAIFFITVNALHVSGGFSAHRQELETVRTASGMCQAFLLLPLKLYTHTKCCVYSFELLMMGGESA
jgi:hypothetical protein